MNRSPMCTDPERGWNSLDSAKKARIFEAQIHAVNYLALRLPTSPNIFIVKRLKIRFMKVYMAHRPQYATVIMLVSAFLWTMLIPWLFVNFWMGYDCNRIPITLSDVKDGKVQSKHFMQRDTCSVHDTFRDLATMLFSGLFKLGILVASFAWMRSASAQWQFRIDALLKPLVPKVYMSGLGSADSEDSGFRFMQRAGREYEQQYSWVHDYFGARDRAQFCLALCVSITLGFVRTGAAYGYSNSGIVGIVRGAITGGGVGYALSQLTLTAMNYLLGANAYLKQAIESELKSHQPHRHVVKDGKLEMTAIRGAVEIARRVVENWKVEGGEKLCERIQNEGEQLLAIIINRLVQKSDAELRTDNGPLYKLFDSCQSFACTEHELVTLSLLNMPLLLIYFYDEEWEVINQYNAKVANERDKWTKVLRFRTIYISNPDVRMCTQSPDGSWDVENIVFDRSQCDESFKVYGNYLALIESEDHKKTK